MMSHVARGALGALRTSLHVSSETWKMVECESVVLASFVAQVRGVRVQPFHDVTFTTMKCTHSMYVVENGCK